MCMWSFNGDKIKILTELRLLKFRHFGSFLHDRIWSLSYQLLLQLSMDLFQTLCTFGEHTKMCMWSFDGDKINFNRITTF